MKRWQISLEECGTHRQINTLRLVRRLNPLEKDGNKYAASALR
jgi:hypothetical protein